MHSAIQPQFEHTAAQYDDYAEQQRDVLKRLCAMAKPFVPVASDVLDVGCGTGYLRHYAPDWELLGCDIAPAMCQQARQVMPSIAAAMESLPIASASVDVWFSSLALQWSEDPQASFAEAFRVLKPNGLLVLSTYVDGTLSKLQRAMEQVDYPVRPFAIAGDYESWLEHAGFVCKLREQQTLNTSHECVLDLLKSMKQLGANRYYPSSQSVMPMSQLRQMVSHYDTKEDGQIQASWELFYVIAEKRG